MRYVVPWLLLCLACSGSGSPSSSSASSASTVVPQQQTAVVADSPAPGNQPDPVPVAAATATVVIRSVLARAIPTDFDSMVIRFYDRDGATVFGPERRFRAAEIRVENVPLTAASMSILYLRGEQQVAAYTQDIRPSADTPVVIEDPTFMQLSELSHLKLLPLESLVPVGGTGSFRAIGVFRRTPKDAIYEMDVTNLCAWSSSNPPVAEVRGPGRLAALAPGRAGVSAKLNGVEPMAPWTMTVSAGHLVDLQISVPTGHLAQPGAIVPCQAFARFSDEPEGPGSGGLISAAWRSSDPSIVTIDPDSGICGVLRPGQATITALAGGREASRLVTVTPHRFPSSTSGGLGSLAISLDIAGMAAADFDRDGNLDYGIVAADGRVGMLSSAAGLTPLGSPARGLAAGDYDEDGLADLATCLADGRVAVELGNGDGSFTAGSRTAAAPSSTMWSSGDFNRDDHLDLLLLGASAQVLLGKGEGSFHPPIGLTLPAPALGAAVADFNGDALPDLALALASGDLVWAAGNGQGGFSPPSAIGDPMADLTSVAEGDLDRDGRPDLAASFRDGVRVFRNSGTGFALASDRMLPGAATTVACVDIDLDGRVDLVSATAGDIWFLQGDAGLGFGAPVNRPTGGFGPGPQRMLVTSYAPRRDFIPDLLFYASTWAGQMVNGI